MSVEVLTSGDPPVSIMFCNTTMWAFGPVMSDTDTDEAYAWIASLPKDPRVMGNDTLESAWSSYWSEREHQREKVRR